MVGFFQNVFKVDLLAIKSYFERLVIYPDFLGKSKSVINHEAHVSVENSLVALHNLDCFKDVVKGFQMLLHDNLNSSKLS